MNKKPIKHKMTGYRGCVHSRFSTELPQMGFKFRSLIRSNTKRLQRIISDHTYEQHIDIDNEEDTNKG